MKNEKKTKKKRKKTQKNNVPGNNFERNKIYSERFVLFSTKCMRLEFSPLSCMVYGKSLDSLLRFFFIVFHLSQITMPLVNNTLLIRTKSAIRKNEKSTAC